MDLSWYLLLSALRQISFPCSILICSIRTDALSSISLSPAAAQAGEIWGLTQRWTTVSLEHMFLPWANSSQLDFGSNTILKPFQSVFYSKPEGILSIKLWERREGFKNIKDVKKMINGDCFYFLMFSKVKEICLI